MVLFVMGAFSFKVVVASSATSPLIQEASALGFHLVPIKIHGIVRNVLRSRLRPYIASRHDHTLKSKSQVSHSLTSSTARSLPKLTLTSLSTRTSISPDTPPRLLDEHILCLDDGEHTQTNQSPNTAINTPKTPSRRPLRMRPSPPPPRGHVIRLGTVHSNVPVKRLYPRESDNLEALKLPLRHTITRAHTNPLPRGAGTIGGCIPESSVRDSQIHQSNSSRTKSLRRVHSSPIPSKRNSQCFNPTKNVPCMCALCSIYQALEKPPETIPIIKTEAINNLPSYDTFDTSAAMPLAAETLPGNQIVHPTLLSPAMPPCSKQNHRFAYLATPSITVSGIAYLNGSFECDNSIGKLPNEGEAQTEIIARSCPSQFKSSPQMKHAQVFTESISGRACKLIQSKATLQRSKSSFASAECEFDEEHFEEDMQPQTSELSDKNGNDDVDKYDDEQSHYGFHPLFGGEGTAISPPLSPKLSPRCQTVGIWETSNNFRYAFCPIPKKKYSFLVRLTNECGPKLGHVTVFSDSGRLKYVAGRESFTGTISKHITWDDGEIWRRPHPMYLRSREDGTHAFPIFS